MAELLRFDGQVAVVTGAGGGLGKTYALLLAERGAAVVVNDLGGSSSGEGANARAADLVVEEIKAKGGKAVANYNSVEEGDKIIQTAIDSYGRVDILINNAGILRDRSMVKMSDEDWDLVHRVHLRGSFITTRAAWPHFRKQNYGRIIMTSSVAGIYGNFGQSNYGAAKLGLLGLSNTVALEGAKYDIHCNTIVPMAGSRLTQGILPPDMMEGMRPDLIAPVVAWLCHKDCKDNGAVIEAAGGWVGKYRWERTQGAVLRDSAEDPVILETVRDNWDKITDFTDSLHPKSNQEASMLLGQVLQDLGEKDAIRKELGSNPSPVDRAVALRVKPVKYHVDSKEIILYNIAVGASTGDKDGLRYLYENDSNFSPVPTFGVLTAQAALVDSGIFSGGLPGFTFELANVLHGEQYIEMHKPLPVHGTLQSQLQIVDILDKKSGALLIINVESFDESKEKVLTAQFVIFVVGSGGFGGKRSSDKLYPVVEPPKRAPDASLQYKTCIDQAALYRLCGDRNPLHIDPSFAAIGGFDKPILHGLCSYGVACRQVLEQYANSDTNLFKAMKARFSSPVIPGQTLKTDMWREGNRIHLEVKVVENGKTVLSGAYIDLKAVSTPATSAPAPPIEAVSTGLESEKVFAELARRLESRPDIAAKVGAVYQWDIKKDGKVAATWTVDLKSKPGEIYLGVPKAHKAQCTLILDDADMVALVTGKLNPQKAFMQGKLKIKGSIMLTQKLQALLKEQSKL